MENEFGLIEIKLLKDDKVIKETLSRIGIANLKTKTIFPSCYLYTHFGKNYIVHFKELFLLTRENGYNNVSEEDKKRRNAIIFCLKKWGLIEVEDSLIEPHSIKVFVLNHKDKKDWKIEHKFNVNNLVQE